MKKIISFLILLVFITGSPTVGMQKVYAEAHNDGYYTILLKEEQNVEDFINRIKKYSGQIDVVYDIPEIGLVQVKAKKEKIEQFKADPSVEEINSSTSVVKPQQILEDTAKSQLTSTASSLWDLQWDVKQVTHNGQSYEKFKGTHNVVVGIIDSGLDVNHPDLAKNIVGKSKNLVPQGGFRGGEQDETGDINYLEDKRGHGTHTAGLIAANGLMKGVAPEVGIRAYRVFGGKSAEPVWIAKAIIEAAKDDVDVINLSLGSYLIEGTIYYKEDSSTKELAEIKAYKKAIQYAKKMGSVVVAAAGNDGIDVTDSEAMDKFLKGEVLKEGVTYKGQGLDIPASLPGVITVASTGPTNELSLFSNYGEGFSDIAAPGGDIRFFNKYGDTWMKDGWFQKEQVISTKPNGGYVYGVGTSTAAPKVSGAVALIIDKYHFKDLPQQATRHLYRFGVDKTSTESHLLGKGILDIYNAVSR
ncbi:S8 family serine peptidase [Bacillus cereus group sp. BfR-BA-01331]|uniref:S8 family peptidase n=1 Tax=Bacillus cereus group sp. BfR-BA-01331 TaxID=2920307 RepID=UPI001F5A3D23|nr:S8 family serine peptidase [Bacillus cereus group sp. BfR-BA-01331]